MSLLAVADTQEETVLLIKSVLEFVARLSAIKNGNYGTS
jgi:hypothetical protein